MLETKYVCVLTKNKVWNPTALKWICLILSIFSGITLYIINFYRLNHPQKHKKLIIGIGVIVIVSVIVFFTPNYPIITLLIFAINISVAIYFNFEQKELFNEHIQNGGGKASTIIAWVFGMLILIGICIIYGVIAIVIEMLRVG